MTLDDYRYKLIDKIIFSKSKDDAQRYVDTAIKSLVSNKVNGHIIYRFIEKIITDLDHFDLPGNDSTQAENVKATRLKLTALKKNLTEKAS